MDKKRIEIISAVVILAVLIALVVWLVVRPGGQPQEPDTAPEARDTVSDPRFPSEATTPDAEPEILPHPVVRTFVERFGSFSTESGYGNIEDVMVLATQDLRVRLQGILEDARRGGGEYYGVSTRVISMDEIERNEETAQFSVTTQREESIVDPSNFSLRYQDIVLELVRSGDTWLVSDFTWQ